MAGIFETHHESCCIEDANDSFAAVTVIDVRTRRLVTYIPGAKFLALYYLR